MCKKTTTNSLDPIWNAYNSLKYANFDQWILHVLQSHQWQLIWNNITKRSHINIKRKRAFKHFLSIFTHSIRSRSWLIFLVVWIIWALFYQQCLDFSHRPFAKRRDYQVTYQLELDYCVTEIPTDLAFRLACWTSFKSY